MNAQDMLTAVSEKNPKAMVVIYIDPKTQQGRASFATGSVQELAYMAATLQCLLHDVLTGKMVLTQEQK